MTDLPAIHGHIDAHLDRHLDSIVAFVRQPSVSLEGLGMQEGAALTTRHLRAIGCGDATVVDVGDAYPGVFGSLDFGRGKTLLIYSHYDVRPVGTEPWTHDPFSGEVTAFGGFPKVVMGRGAAAKGPLQGFLNAVGSILAVERSLPVNLVFLVEGAEILGSPNYGKLVERHRSAVEKADAIYGPRASQDAAGGVAVTLGYKGLIYLEMIASGEAWGRGPQGAPVHSATNAIVDNPAWRLVRAVSMMTDETGTKIAIPKPKTIAAWEQPFLDALVARAESSDPNGFIPGLSPTAPIHLFRGDVEGGELVRQYLYGPSMNISGLRAGYTGPGTKSFLLPDKAVATMDLRLVTDIPASDILAILRSHLDAAGFPDIAIDAKCAYDWNQTSVRSDLVATALGLLDKAGYARSVWPMQAFGGPWAHFAKVFGIPSLIGAAPGHGARVPTSDEFFVVDAKDKIAGLATLEKHFADFLFAYADAPAS
jgi:acetylornithine deacetylase/succinyl-diaminopimelate desuccinylase-like protein